MRKLEKKDKEWSLEVRMKMCSTYRLFSCKSNSFSYERFGLRTLLVTETEAQLIDHDYRETGRAVIGSAEIFRL